MSIAKKKHKIKDWRPIFKENGITIRQVYLDVSGFFHICGYSGFCKWIRGDNKLPDLIYGYLFGRFYWKKG